MAFKWRQHPNKIIQTKIEGNGKAALHMATRWARLIDKFVPLRTGTLAKPLIEPTGPRQAVIIYNTPYARRQYFGTRTPNPGGRLTLHNFNTATKPLAAHRWHDVGLKAGLGRRLLAEMKAYFKRVFR